MTDTWPIIKSMNGVLPLILRCLPTLLLCSLPALSSTVYKTVDENGVVSFSDTPPEGDTRVETMQINAPDPQLDPEDQARLAAMRETTDRMAADRREREKHRAELRRLQAETTPPPNYTTEDYTDYLGYSSRYSGYYSGPVYRPWRPGYRPGHPVYRPGHPGHRPGRPPGYRPRPEHPIARPPLRQPPQVQLGSNAQLMRPLVSPRR